MSQTNSAQPPVTTVFHGTACNYIDLFRKEGPRVSGQRHLPKWAFCTSTDFKEAERFAIRHTPANDLNKPGIVIEFDASLCSPKQYKHVKDVATMYDEKEVAFFKTSGLRIVAVWWLRSDGWVRVPEPVGVAA